MDNLQAFLREAEIAVNPEVSFQESIEAAELCQALWKLLTDEEKKEAWRNLGLGK